MTDNVTKENKDLNVDVNAPKISDFQNENTNEVIENNLKRITQLLEISKEIKKTDPLLGDILFDQFSNAFEIYETVIENKPLDISESLQKLSTWLHIDLEEVIRDILRREAEEDDDKNIEMLLQDQSEPELEKDIENCLSDLKNDEPRCDCNKSQNNQCRNETQSNSYVQPGFDVKVDKNEVNDYLKFVSETKEKIGDTVLTKVFENNDNCDCNCQSTEYIIEHSELNDNETQEAEDFITSAINELK